MNTSWQAMGAVFQQVYDLPPDDRARCLDQLCADDEVLRSEVESLLRAHDLANHFTEEGYTVAVEELSPAARRLAPVRQLGPYTLLSELGRGGMSTVFLAARSDDQFDRLVAIKTLGAVGSAEGYERFLAERQLHANLEHPGIARLYGGGTSDQGVPYIVMEYIEGGEPIDAYCDHHSLDARARIKLFRAVCDAVAYAHRNLVVHRDLKPGNILVAPEGKARLLDFGISKLLSAEGKAWDPTGVGPGPLTPSYASPEQLLGEPITTSSDIFSLGVLLFRLLAGRLPSAGSLGERLRVLKDESTPPSLERAAQAEGAASGERPPFLALERSPRRDLEAIVNKALQREPQDRYSTVEKLDDDLRRWQRGLTVTARRPTPAYRLSRWLRRNWLLASFAAAVVVTLLVSSLVLAAQKDQVAHQRDRARDEAAKSEQVLGLLLDLFAGSDPRQTQGADVSVRDVLRAAEPRIERELAAQPRVQAALFEAVGRVFLSLGHLDEAEHSLQRARALWQATTWPTAATGAPTLDLLARVHIRRGAFEEALALLEYGRQLRQAALGPGSVEEACSLARIAYVRLLLYQDDEAEKTAREAVALFRQHPEAGFEEERIEAKFNLGEAIYRRGGRPLVEPLFEEILEEATASLGAEHPSTLAILGKLATLKAEHPAQLEVAEGYARERLARLRRIYEGDHHEIATSLDVLASILARAGKLAAAEEAFEESIAMQRSLEGEESPFLAVTLGNLGWFHLFRRHDPARAEPILRQALAMAETFFSPTAYVLTYPLIGIGRCRTLQGEPGQGEPFLARALAARRASHEADSLPVARAELFLGENLAAQGRCDEAAPLLRHARTRLQQGGEPDDLSRLQAPWQAFTAHCGDVQGASHGG